MENTRALAWDKEISREQVTLLQCNVTINKSDGPLSIKNNK